jgi:hypothetical protein
MFKIKDPAVRLVCGMYILFFSLTLILVGFQEILGIDLRPKNDTDRAVIWVVFFCLIFPISIGGEKIGDWLFKPKKNTSKVKEAE